MEEVCRKYAPKTKPKPPFNFGKQPKTNTLCQKSF